MILAVQHAVQLFANLVVASTMAMSIAIGVAGAFHQRFPIDCVSCQAGAPADVAAAPKRTLVVAALR